MGGRVASLICTALIAVGCSKPAPDVAAPKPKANSAWPADTLDKPEFVGVVERNAGRIKGDAEPARIPSAYQIPDWAEPTSPISMKGPQGSKLAFHLLPRTPGLKKQDDAHVRDLLKGKKRSAETLIVARPWIGWYGQGSGVEALPENKQRPYALRVYNLFDGGITLQVHLEWPTGDKDAYDEGQELLAHVVYSVRPNP